MLETILMSKEFSIPDHCYYCKYWNPPDDINELREDYFKKGNLAVPAGQAGNCLAVQLKEAVITRKTVSKNLLPDQTSGQQICIAKVEKNPAFEAHYAIDVRDFARMSKKIAKHMDDK